MRIRTAHDLAAFARGRRRALGWSQGELAERSGVSRKWVSDFEAGKASVATDLVLAVLSELGLELVGRVPADPPGLHP